MVRQDLAARMAGPEVMTWRTEPRECAHCPVTFEARIGGSPQKYCSDACRRAAKVEYDRTYHLAEHGKKIARTECWVCSEPLPAPLPRASHRLYCTAACAQRAWYQKNKDAGNESTSRRQYRDNPRYRKTRLASNRARDLWKNYRMTEDEYDTLLEAQEGKCAICGTDDPSPRKHFSVDHDHTCCAGRLACGKCNRGLLCGLCNSGLGQFRDSVDTLRSAIKYLENL